MIHAIRPLIATLGCCSLILVGSACAPQRPSGTLPPVERVTSIASVGAHTCALDQNGSVLCWGSNQDGQLGIDALDYAPLPVVVLPPAAATPPAG